LKAPASVPSILKTSVPAALDLASQPVMWLIEAVFIGHLSAAALGGVGFALQIILLTSTLLFTLVIGAIILVNRHLGSNDRWGANHILGQTVMAGLIISVPIGLVWYFGSPFIFNLIREQEIVSRMAGDSYISGMEAGVQYMRTVAFFTPLLVPNFIALGLIRGSGDTHKSMVINLTMNATNVALTPILIYGLFGFPRMEVRGAALAMGLAHTLGFSMTLFILRRRTSTLFLSFRELVRPKWISFKQLFRLGLPTTVEQVVWSGGQLIVTGYVALMGISELAVHQVFLRVQGVLSMFYLGFGMAAMTQIGKHLGANDHHHAEQSSKVTHRIVFLFGLSILLLMVIFSRPMLDIFFRKEDVVIAQFGFRLAFILFAMTQLPKAMNVVLAGSLRGAGDIRWIMWINIAGVLLLQVGFNWIGTFILHFGLVGIWAIQFSDELLKSLLNYNRFRGGKWKLIRI
jgi:putative MATE family efflux protein